VQPTLETAVPQSARRSRSVLENSRRASSDGLQSFCEALLACGDRERKDVGADAILRQRWVNVLERDAYYNPNLSRERVDFSLELNLSIPVSFRAEQSVVEESRGNSVECLNGMSRPSLHMTTLSDD
jgi:hypothetical protein